MKRYPLIRPPKALRKARVDNIAIVPASQLPFKAVWQQVANTLPQGSILLYHFPQNKPYLQIMNKVRDLFEEKGYRVTILAKG
jgi:hypothetical protein